MKSIISLVLFITLLFVTMAPVHGLPPIPGTSDILGGKMTLNVDGSGGAGGGWEYLVVSDSIHGALQNFLSSGYFSVAEPGVTFRFVNDGLSGRDAQNLALGAGPDWSVSTAIATAPTILTMTSTMAQWKDPQFNSQQVDQLTFADSASTTDWAIVAFQVLNIWGTDFSSAANTSLRPTIWLDFNANNETDDSCAYDTVNQLAYHFDAGEEYVGVRLLTGTVSNVSFETAYPSGVDGAAADEAELVVIEGNDTAPGAVSGSDYITTMTGSTWDPLNDGDSQVFALAICAGDDLADIQAASAAAQTWWTANVAAAITGGMKFDQPLSVTTTTVPNGQETVAWTSNPLTATGGVAPYTWSLGAVNPTWVTAINPTTGEITGTPPFSSSGTVTVSATVQDFYDFTKTASFTVAITSLNVLAILSTSLGSTVTEGVPFTTPALSAAGGTAPYTWTVVGAPSWVSFMASTTGIISGTPPSGSAGSYPMTINVADSVIGTDSALLTLTVSAPASTLLTSSGGACTLNQSTWNLATFGFLGFFALVLLRRRQRSRG